MPPVPNPSPPIPPALAPEFEICAEIVRRRARNFYYGLRLTPEPRRSAIYSIYAWMRKADDAADDPATLDARAAALAALRSQTDAALDPTASDPADPVLAALRWSVAAFELDPQDILPLLAALEDDIQREAAACNASASARKSDPTPDFQTRDDLTKYCHAVASTAGVACVGIWGLEDPSKRELARALAVRRGVAFQLTNILRDFAEDFASMRVYIPAEDFNAHNTTPASVAQWADPNKSAALIRSIAQWARNEYEASAPLDDLIAKDARAALVAMTRIYSGILNIIFEHPQRITHARVRLPAVKKAAIAARAVLQKRGVTM